MASDVAKGGGGKFFWPSLIMVNGRWEGQVEVRAGKGGGHGRDVTPPRESVSSFHIAG